MEDGFFILRHEIGKSTEHCMLSFLLADVKHMGEVCFVHLFTGQRGPTLSVLCTFCCFPVGGQGARSERRVALSVFSASCPQASLMAISEGLHLLTRSSSQQTDSSCCVWISWAQHVTYIYTQRPDNQALYSDTPHRDCWLTLSLGSCIRHLYVWCSCDTDVIVPKKQ